MLTLLVWRGWPCVTGTLSGVPALKVAPLQEANRYLERFRALWDDRLDRMELYLKKLQADQ